MSSVGHFVALTQKALLPHSTEGGGMHPPPIRPSLRPSNLTGKVGKEKTVRRSRYSVSADKKNPSMRHRKGLIHGVYMDGISADIEADSLSHLVLCF